MRSHGRWTTTFLVMLLVVLALDACTAATSGATPTTTTARQTAAPAPPPAGGTGAGGASVAWTAFARDGAIQVWLATSDDSPRLLATLAQASTSCQLVAAGLPMLSPDGAHLLVSEGERCDGLILDPGPLVVVDVASGRTSTVPLPNDASVLPQVRSYGWVDNRTVFGLSPKY